MIVYALCNNFPLGNSIYGNFNKYYCLSDPTGWRDMMSRE